MKSVFFTIVYISFRETVIVLSDI